MMVTKIFLWIMVLFVSFNASADDTDVFTHGLDTAICDEPRGASPVIPISQLNPFEHEKDIYYPVFQPSLRSYWQGNVKRYELDGSDLGERNVLSYPGGGESKYAVVNCQGLGGRHGWCFSHGNTNTQRARSWWNDNPQADGAIVAEGGAAAQVDSNHSRRVYVQDSMNTLNRVEGLESDHYLLEKSYGAPLHSKPLIVDYGGVNNGTRQVLFTSTNGGFLHAVDAETGAELSAVFPKSLQSNIEKYKNRGDGPLVYGMDGQWAVWRHDGNEDGRIDKFTDEDFVYLYGGMRRGGRHLYGFDVTDPERPRILFDISPNSSLKVLHLGQVWAKPTLAWVRLPNHTQPVAVLLVGGGYDTSYDLSDDPSENVGINDRASAEAAYCLDTKVQCGNQVFMVLAQKEAGSYRAGDIVWWSSGSSHSSLENSAMQDSVVGRIRTIDEDGDGYFDYFYAVDIAGRVFVYSFSQAQNSERHKRDIRNISVSLLAKLNSANTRFFYESPSLSVGKDRIGYYRLITIGSGWRANPLNEMTNNAFFVIKDRPHLKGPPLQANDLPEFGTHFFADKIMLNGFKVSLLGAGEKVFGSSTVINNRVFFSTYIPGIANDKDSAGLCGVYRGNVSLYGIDISTGFGVFGSDGGIIDSTVGGSHVLEGLGLSALGDINSVMTRSSMNVLSGSQFMGGLEAPPNVVHRLSWHEAA
ncbi:MAG: hypothetical protein KUG73_06495, partial [Pseudomonadales bacterium]|nr:hypothetical protein [Pseudomonadales bacterium]